MALSKKSASATAALTSNKLESSPNNKYNTNSSSSSSSHTCENSKRFLSCTDAHKSKMTTSAGPNVTAIPINQLVPSSTSLIKSTSTTSNDNVNAKSNYYNNNDKKPLDNVIIPQQHQDAIATSSNGLSESTGQSSAASSAKAVNNNAGSANTSARKRGRRRQQAIPESSNGLDRVFVWDLDNSLVRGDVIIANYNNGGLSSIEPSVLPSVTDKLGALAERLKELTMFFCENHFNLSELNSTDQIHIDDVPIQQPQQPQSQSQIQIQPATSSTCTTSIERPQPKEPMIKFENTTSDSRIASSSISTTSTSSSSSSASVSSSITIISQSNMPLPVPVPAADQDMMQQHQQHQSIEQPNELNGTADEMQHQPYGSEQQNLDLLHNEVIMPQEDNRVSIVMSQQQQLHHHHHHRVGQLDEQNPIHSTHLNNSYSQYEAPNQNQHNHQNSHQNHQQHSNQLHHSHHQHQLIHQHQHHPHTHSHPHPHPHPIPVPHPHLNSHNHNHGHNHNHSHSHSHNHNHIHNHGQSHNHSHSHSHHNSFRIPNSSVMSTGATTAQNYIISTGTNENNAIVETNSDPLLWSGLELHNNLQQQQNEVDLMPPHANPQSNYPNYLDYNHGFADQQFPATNQQHYDQNQVDPVHRISHDQHTMDDHGHGNNPEPSYHQLTGPINSVRSSHLITTNNDQLLWQNVENNPNSQHYVGSQYPYNTSGNDYYATTQNNNNPGQLQQQAYSDNNHLIRHHQDHSQQQAHHIHLDSNSMLLDTQTVHSHSHQNQLYQADINHQHHPHSRTNSMNSLSDPIGQPEVHSNFHQLQPHQIYQHHVDDQVLHTQIEPQQQIHSSSQQYPTMLPQDYNQSQIHDQEKKSHVIKKKETDLRQSSPDKLQLLMNSISGPDFNNNQDFPGQTMRANSSQQMQQQQQQQQANKQVTNRLSSKFHRIRIVYNLNRDDLKGSSESLLASIDSSVTTVTTTASSDSSDNNIDNGCNQDQVQQQRIAIMKLELNDVLAEIDHHTLDWRKRSIECLRLISESQNCTNVIITKLPLIIALAHIICLGFGRYFQVDQVYSAHKTSKEACIKRIKKKFGASNRCSYIIVGGRDDVEMAKRLDLPSWNTSHGEGHRQLVQLVNALEAGWFFG